MTGCYVQIPYTRLNEETITAFKEHGEKMAKWHQQNNHVTNTGSMDSAYHDKDRQCEMGVHEINPSNRYNVHRVVS